MNKPSSLPPYFTDSLLRQSAGATLYNRGMSLFKTYAVVNLIQLEQTLKAQVEGTAELPYRVSLKFGADQLQSVDCNCPYDGIWCKHLVAMGLAALDAPEEIIEIQALQPQLEALNQAELISLMLKLVDEEPELALSLQSWIERLNYSRDPVSQSEDHLDLEKLRVKTRQYLGKSLKRGGPIIYQAEEVLDSAPELLDQAEQLFKQGRIRSVSVMLEEITRAYIPAFESAMRWDDEEIEQDELERIGTLWGEVLLRLDPASLTSELYEQLKDWYTQLDDFWGGDDFLVALAVFEADQELFEAALNGDVAPEIWAEEAGNDEIRLVEPRLRLLEERGQWQAVLNLAYAAHHTVFTARALIALGQAEDALEFIREQLTEQQDAKLNLVDLCTRFEASGKPELALELAKQALGQPLTDLQLPAWAVESSQLHGDRPLLLLAAWKLAILEATKSSWSRLKALHGAAWVNESERFSQELLKTHPTFKADMIEILLAEGRNQEVMSFVSKFPYGWENKRLALIGLMKQEPKWCLDLARREAEEIIKGGKNQMYDRVPEWLGFVHQAFLQLKQEKQWQAYLAELIVLNKRKRSLLPYLESLQAL